MQLIYIDVMFCTVVGTAVRWKTVDVSILFVSDINHVEDAEIRNSSPNTENRR